MVSIEALSATLRSIAAPGMSPKALRSAVRERHPDASKKEVARAAFYALIEVQSQSEHGMDELHSFALAERTPDDEPPVKIGERRKKKRERTAVTPSGTAGAAV